MKTIEKMAEVLRLCDEVEKATTEESLAVVAALRSEIDVLNNRLLRWHDAHEEMIGEVELRTRVQTLEMFIKSRGYDVPEG